MADTNLDLYYLQGDLIFVFVYTTSVEFFVCTTMLAGLKFVPREKLDKVIPVTFLLFFFGFNFKELCVLFLLNTLAYCLSNLCFVY